MIWLLPAAIAALTLTGCPGKKERKQWPSPDRGLPKHPKLESRKAWPDYTMGLASSSRLEKIRNGRGYWGK